MSRGTHIGPPVKVNWLGLPRKFYVRRTSATGYVTGYLTDRGGWGTTRLAIPFESAADATSAIVNAKGARFANVLDNTKADENQSVAQPVRHVTEHVACRICGALTRSKGTQLCDGCWELEHRIHLDIELARKIVAAYPNELRNYTANGGRL